MKLSELLGTLGWSDVKASLIWCYPDSRKSIDGYQQVFNELRSLVPVESEMRIIIREVCKEDIDDEPYVEAFGRNGELNRDMKDFQYLEQHVDSEYANAETDFSLLFECWEKWLGMEIDSCSFENYSGAQIAAHCLWEMTFHGFEQTQILAEKDELQRRVDELNAMSEQERKEKLIPMEDVMRKFEALKKEK